MLKQGDKIYLILRKLFDGDRTRHFVGEVLEMSSTVVLARGYAFVHDSFTNDFVRRDDTRTRIISLVDAANIIFVVPEETIIEDVRFEVNSRNQHVITDKASFVMNLSEIWVSK